MPLIRLLLEYYLKPRDQKPFLIGWILGSFLLVLAGGMGVFFLFQGLVPVIGYVSSGAVICTLLAIGGGTILFLSRPKKPHPLTDLLGQTQLVIKNMDIDFAKFFQNKAVKALLISFAGGLILSQLKNMNISSRLQSIKSTLINKF